MKMKNTINKSSVQHTFVFVTLMLCSLTQANNNVGNLLWQDNFNSVNPDTWHVDIGDGCDKGLFGWGNQELQWYAESNSYYADFAAHSSFQISSENIHTLYLISEIKCS
jgi:hypothetical protein